jgi:multiple sugar transport system permease protein
VFAFIVAVLFKRPSKMIRFYQAAYYLPSIVGGSIAVAVMWRRLFMSDGAVNAILQTLGINSTISWIGRIDTAIWTLVLLAVWQFGSSMLIFLAGLLSAVLSSWAASLRVSRIKPAEVLRYE